MQSQRLTPNYTTVMILGYKAFMFNESIEYKKIKILKSVGKLWTDLQIMVDPGNLVPRRKISSQKENGLVYRTCHRFLINDKKQQRKKENILISLDYQRRNQLTEGIPSVSGSSRRISLWKIKMENFLISLDSLRRNSKPWQMWCCCKWSYELVLE